MFDDLFDMLMPDEIDCMIECHQLKEQAKNMVTLDLIESILDRVTKVDIDKSIDKIIAKYNRTGRITKGERKALEDCFVILEVSICISDDGEIYMSTTI